VVKRKDCKDGASEEGEETVTPKRLIQENESLTVREIAERLSVTDATVRVWINTGKLPAYKLPGSGSQSIIRVSREAFDRFLKSTTDCS
jgi:excisionase family DNA binding protein